MKKLIPFARFGLIVPLINFLNDIGSNINSHLQETHIPADILEDTERIVPLPMLINFISKTADAEGIENLGLTSASKTKITHTGTFGNLLAQSLNTYDLIKRLCYLANYTISTHGEKFWWVEKKECIWLCQNFTTPIRKLSGIDSTFYYSLGLMIDTLRLTLGSEWQPPEIHLPTKYYKNSEEVFNLPNTRFYYQQSFTAICIPKKQLIQGINRTNKNYNFSSNLDIMGWKNELINLEFVEGLQETIKLLLLEKYPTINTTAESCGLSVRSLQRYLSNHNLTYSQLIDKVRYELALELLVDNNISLLDITYYLGFQDQANFSHAFRRWTGVTPSSFRNTLLNT